ncbi:hypothetical protein A3F62_01735 [Candidatus Woesebacteria bacterium RIFCSPHIGHO2_12_FULL_44_11]|uniref:Carbohydrate kinase PfkB domain-containing protein n=1 Tax=Candidatus Woesebacteria bacterium RIFCSPLOWO2_01_FULL_44_14 TaxID=1802525 RepID=A0A1F8C019_9BACT|nr:MAG: hypothetical protein A3F62_01735 [Candidatus Woesebacteria bacterium RIFCSPHIGHO2_12_FULL_44_11]OGM69677.1 MAG: hypothetical protein A2975_01020 [Candidatus Woesebacteria bacterium RIFCSPLOWO2_01_FULL_44_14]
MSEIELLSLGDATLDVFIAPSESETLCQIDTKECFIAFSYGEKIPVKSLEFSIGGNAANNAIGTGRLGINSSAVLTLGDDTIARRIVEMLETETVDTSFVVQQPSTASNYNTVVTYGGERTIFTYKAPRSYEWPVKLPVAPWVYYTSMGDSFAPFQNHLVEWLVKNPGIKLGFNPGSRQLKAGVEALNAVLKLTSIIFINREEAEGLTGFTASSGREKELLQAVKNLGPKVCVVTDGGNGSYVTDGQKFLHAGILPIDAYERTGAGDAFGSGCLAAIIKGKSLEEALLWGTLNSASVIGYTGSQKGLLRETDIPVWIERAKSSGVGVKEI